MKVKKVVEVEIDMQPQQIAEIFCGMSNIEQAIFFNSVAVYVEEYKRPFCFQLQAVVDSELLTKEAKNVMWEIGNYSS